MAHKKTLASILLATALSSCDGCKQPQLISAECAYQQNHYIEICNGIDDNCNGLIDESISDAKNPCGYNGRGKLTYECKEGAWFMKGSCEDNDLCPIGDRQGYYTGPEATRHVGECKDGLMECFALENSASWLALTADKQPTAEACNDKDDDCDGITDNREKILPEPCWGDLPEQYRNVGACQSGWKGCDDAVCHIYHPQPEQCNTIDDDCNGTIDDLRIITYTGPLETQDVGNCKSNIDECLIGENGNPTLARVQHEVLPQDERCDALYKDYNCNGILAKDETIPNQAYVLFFFDNSGSYGYHDEYPIAFNAMCTLAYHLANTPEMNYYLGLILVPDDETETHAEVLLNYIPARQFARECATLSFNPTNYYEPFYDALYNAASPTNPYSLTKPINAPEYFIAFTDADPPYSLHGLIDNLPALTEADVLTQTENANVSVTMFIPLDYAALTDAFDTIVNGTNGNFYELTNATPVSDVVLNLEKIIQQCK